MATNQNATITKTEIRKGDCILKEIDASEILHRPFASNFLKRIGRGTAVGMATGLIVTTFRKIIDDNAAGTQRYLSLYANSLSDAGRISDRHGYLMADHVTPIKKSFI
jgi:hypothetical protein